MRFCLAAAAAWMAVGVATVEAASAGGTIHETRSVVRADPRSGRLVRALVVPSRPVARREVKPVAVPPVRPADTAPREPTSLEVFIDQTARRYEIDPLLVHSVIKVESNYDPWAVSPKGAQGLMQLMPATARRFNVGDAFNPAENIDAGVRYLKYLLTLFNDERLALAAYNAGEGAVYRYGNIPPYRETNEYVYKVGQKMGEARRETGRRQSGPPARPNQPAIEEYLDSTGRLHIETRVTQ